MKKYILKFTDKEISMIHTSILTQIVKLQVLCDLYYPPYNFERTGCKGCPFALNLQEQLSLMELYLPNERKQCEFIWKPIYDEYRKLNYRLNRKEQLKLI